MRRTKTRRKKYWTLSTKICALTPRYVQNKSRGAIDLEGRPTGTGKRDRVVYRARFMLKNKTGPKVLMNEDLISTHAALAFQTRQLKKKGKVMDCWTAAGKVMIKDNSGRVVHVTSESELAIYGQK